MFNWHDWEDRLLAVIIALIQIRDVFQEYSKALEKIAHLMPADLHRLLDKESQVRLCGLGIAAYGKPPDTDRISDQQIMVFIHRWSLLGHPVL